MLFRVSDNYLRHLVVLFLAVLFLTVLASSVSADTNASIFVSSSSVSDTNHSVGNASNTINYMVVEDLSTPFQIAHAGQHSGGIISDISTEVFRDSNFNLVAQTFPIKRLHKFVREENSVAWLAYDAKVWQSLTDVGELIEPSLFTVKHSLATCSDELNRIDNNKSVLGAQFAILDNFQYPDLDTLEHKGLISLVPVESYTRGFILTAARRVTGFVEMDIRLKYNFNRLQSQNDCIKFLDFSPIIKAYDIYLILSNNAPAETRRFINERVKKLKDDGTIEMILRRYTTELF